MMKDVQWLSDDSKLIEVSQKAVHALVGLKEENPGKSPRIAISGFG